MQRDFRIKLAELSERVPELHHHHDIALLDELLHDIQCQHGLAAAGGCHHDAVAGRYAFFLRVPDILFQRYLINTVIEIHPFLIRGECRVVDEQTEREGKRGQEQETAVKPFLLSGNRSQVYVGQMLVGRYIEFEVRDGQVFPQLLLGPVQQFRAVIPYHDGKIGTAEELPLLHDLLLHVLELVRLRLQHGPVPSLVGAVDRHTAGELFIKFLRSLEIEDLVDRMVAVQVHAQAFQFRHVQAASGHGQCGVLHIASDGAVRQIVTVTDGIATRFLPVDGDLSGEMNVTVAVSPGEEVDVPDDILPQAGGGHPFQTGVPDTVYHTNGGVHPLQKFGEFLPVGHMQPLPVGERVGIVRGCQGGQAGQGEYQKTVMFQILTAGEMPLFRLVDEAVPFQLMNVLPFKEHVLLVHEAAGGQVFERLVETRVALLQVGTVQAVAFRIVHAERYRHAAVSGKDDTVFVIDDIQYGISFVCHFLIVCFFICYPVQLLFISLQQ